MGDIMASFQTYYNYIFYDLEDPRVKGWLLAGSPLIPATMVIIYLLLVYWWLPKFMENRKPYSLRSTIFFYNIFQIVACVGLMSLARTTGKSNYWFGCYPTDYSQNPATLRILLFGWLTYVLKFIELIETVFFVLRKKYRQVSVLHVYHHVSTFVTCWVALKYVAGGMTAFVSFINAGVHIIMYSYYLLATTTSPNVQAMIAALKPLITVLQMAQLCVIIVLGTIPLRSDCNASILVSWMCIPSVLVVLALFANFYRRNYAKEHEKKL